MEYVEFYLPDTGWKSYNGETSQLSQLYDEIYEQGSLDYEIERFSDDGMCQILIYREF